MGLRDELEFVDGVNVGLRLSRLLVAICLRAVEFLSRLLVTIWWRRSRLEPVFVSDGLPWIHTWDYVQFCCFFKKKTLRTGFFYTSLSIFFFFFFIKGGLPGEHDRRIGRDDGEDHRSDSAGTEFLISRSTGYVAGAIAHPIDSNGYDSRVSIVAYCIHYRFVSRKSDCSRGDNVSESSLWRPKDSLRPLRECALPTAYPCKRWKFNLNLI